ncbi:S41 family peptidase [Sandarakinorhabdus oryzae]|uniref:S41 family peptidase n=1 Tax=Sandarakinorhabdus oryzae TaxID=2675220 RepID=UPI0012E165E4|nr:S41 family peptidase [Sandarakinorhabdus oryzae]
MTNRLRWMGAGAAALMTASSAQAASPQRLLQQPVLSATHIAFVSGGDLWVSPRAGGKAVRLTTGVGIEQAPSFSPDGQTIAFTGEYDGNTDVFTVPVAGGVPKRLTYHPAADNAVGWSPDGTKIIFRSNRDSASRYVRLWQVNAGGGAASVLPLPMAHLGALSPDGKAIAYTPQEQGFSFAHTRYTAWGNYRGGLAGAVWITQLNGLATTKVPQQGGADFSPVWLGGQVYFLSGRKGPISVYRFDPASGQTSLVWQNTGPDIRSLSTDGTTLVFDRLGTIFTLMPGEEPKAVSIDLDGDMPDVRPRVTNVGAEVQSVSVSPTGIRAAVEAHGEILSLAVKDGITRTITATPGTMERSPAWSPDGQSIAYFSDESGLYALHVASQQGAGKAVKKYALAAEPAYYFNPLWSPDGKRIAFQDNRLNTWILDLATGKLVAAGPPDEFGGFANGARGMAWSPDSQWFVYARVSGNHFPVLMLHEVATGKATQITDAMAMASDPAFDRDGKYLYFLASNNAGATIYPLDMSTDHYRPTSSIYALALTAGTPSPLAPELGDEKAPPPPAAPDKKADAKKPAAAPATPATKIDLASLSLDQIARRMVALPLPAADYRNLVAGKGGVLWVLKANEPLDIDGDGPPGATLLRWQLEGKKTETLFDGAQSFSLSADGNKLLVNTGKAWLVADGAKPFKPSDPDVKLKTESLMVRVYPAAEWAQMYREVWRVQRAYFYDPNFHGYNVDAAEKALAAWLPGIQSRGDLNYLFHEALTGFSIGHLRGGGGAIPAAKKIPGGLLGADYAIRDNRWCIARIHDGGTWTPDIKAPLAQPGLDVKAGDCITAINGQTVSAAEDIQKYLEGTADQAVTLSIARAGQPARDVTVVPIASEARLRNLTWIEDNRRRVDKLSGGKLGYVYLPNTGGGGFTSFNRYYFAQTDRQGMVIDDRWNGGGQAADYFIEVMNRRLISWWQPRYGRIDRTPAASVLGPKVMLINEGSASGGDMLPWMFRDFKLGPLVGKRTWGGLVGIGGIPPLMDGGQLTSPNVGFFSPAGEWAVENHGVPPDVEVDQDPAAVMAGGDPQLEKAVALALDALAKNPPPTPKRPPFPLYGPDGPIRR